MGTSGVINRACKRCCKWHQYRIMVRLCWSNENLGDVDHVLGLGLGLYLDTGEGIIVTLYIASLIVVERGMSGC